MTNLTPEQLAAFAELTADLDPRITLTVEAMSLMLRLGTPQEKVFATTIRALHDSHGEIEIALALAALTILRMAQVSNAIEDHMAEHHGN
jgi:hypothetical protein